MHVLAMTGRLLCFFIFLVGCKEAPSVNRSSAASGQSTLAGTWQGIQSIEPNGQGSFARMELEDAPGGLVKGALQVAYGMDANDLGTIGRVTGPAIGGTFSRGFFLPDGGIQTKTTMAVTPSRSFNHIDMVEQQATLDGGPLPVYYRFDRQ